MFMICIWIKAKKNFLLSDKDPGLKKRIEQAIRSLAASKTTSAGRVVSVTRKMIDDYIDNVNTDLDKDRIKVNMRELMTEAQSLELSW